MIDVEAQAKMVSFIGADKSAIGGTASHPLHFMYAAPPGLQRDATKDKTSASGALLPVMPPIPTSLTHAFLLLPDRTFPIPLPQNPPPYPQSPSLVRWLGFLELPPPLPPLRLRAARMAATR
jgi:hypothetical protein